MSSRSVSLPFALAVVAGVVSVFSLGVFVGRSAVVSPLTAREDIDKKESSPKEKAKDKNKENIANNSEASADSFPASSNRITLHDSSGSHDTLSLIPIGRTRSIYRLCVGTPRQGALVLASRACLELDLHNASASVDGLADYSHIWIVFGFHLNTLSQQQQSQQQRRTERSHQPSVFHFKAKIAPPALGGRKVGVLATRSPHRPNPVGLTLVRLERIEQLAASRGSSSVSRTAARARLWVSGIDLVDGTPIYDVKPYVPHYDSIADHTQVNVPDWVERGLRSRRFVEWTAQAEEDLHALLQAHCKGNATRRKENEKTNDKLELRGKVLDLLDDAVSSSKKNRGVNFDQLYRHVRDCVEQVLQVDVRSRYQTSKAREGRSQAQRAQRLQDRSSNPIEPQQQAVKKKGDMVVAGNSSTDDSSSRGALQRSVTSSICTQQLDNMLISFVVLEASLSSNPNSKGSGAEDWVRIVQIEYWPQQAPTK